MKNYERRKMLESRPDLVEKLHWKHGANGEDESWEIPSRSAVSLLLCLPSILEMLPKSLRPRVEDTSERMQVAARSSSSRNARGFGCGD